MVVLNQEKICSNNLFVNLLSGASVSNVKPVVSYDSQFVIIGSGSVAKVFVVKSGECIHALKFHSRPIVSVRHNKKNDLQVYTCSDDGLVVRWDYIEGKVLQSTALHMPVCSFYAPSVSGPWYVTKAFEDHHRLYCVLPKKNGQSLAYIKSVVKTAKPEENSVDFGVMGTFCASVFGNTLTVYIPKNQIVKKHKTGERILMCVSCHPSDCVIATGDGAGRIILWSNALDSNHPIRSIYHWHTLPVADLAFSSEGSYLYSGGGEAVLVKWNLFSEEKFFLPRMGSAITFISTPKDNKCVLIAHQDNALQVVDGQRNIVQVIQGLTKSSFDLPVGLLLNSRLRTLILNGKPGHLQFYDISQDKHLFNLDVTGHNFISRERDAVVLNIDVQKAAVDDSGLWLATAEFWSNSDTSPQMWLKFWYFSVEKQTYVLNTNVILPHNKELNCILFRPQKDTTSPPLAVTTSSDGRFKIWMLGSDEGKPNWSCESMGCYRGLPAGSASFSDEGSLLAVAFGSAATLWTVDGVSLKAILCRDKNKKPIKQLLFGHQSCCHYLVCQDGASITVWNILTLSVSWVVHNEVQVLTADQMSSNFAAFCKGQNLILFSPNNPKPLHYLQKVSEQSILSAVFVPNASWSAENTNCFHSHSRLFFADESQSLFSMSEIAEPETEGKSGKKPSKQNVLTPFSAMQAVQKISDVKKPEAEAVGVAQIKEKELIIQNPTLQNPLALCSSILPTLLIPAKVECSSGDGLFSSCGEESKILTTSSKWVPITLEDVKPTFLDFNFLSGTVAF